MAGSFAWFFGNALASGTRIRSGCICLAMACFSVRMAIRAVLGERSKVDDKTVILNTDAANSVGILPLPLSLLLAARQCAIEPLRSDGKARCWPCSIFPCRSFSWKGSLGSGLMFVLQSRPECLLPWYRCTNYDKSHRYTY